MYLWPKNCQRCPNYTDDVVVTNTHEKSHAYTVNIKYIITKFRNNWEYVHLESTNKT